MTSRLTPAMLATFRDRIANGKAVKDHGDSPARWANLETARTVRAVTKPLALFLDLEEEAEHDPGVEVTTKTLALIIGDDEARKGAKITQLFGPAQSGARSAQQRVYLWREVRAKAHRLMISRLIQKLARSLATELGQM